MDLTQLKPSSKSPDVILAIIEIPENSGVKYELDKDTGIMMADRFLHGANVFPFNYGFIAGTLGEDGDPLDVIIVSSSTMAAGTGIMARPVGLLEMEDEAGPDAKIIAVPIEKVDPFYAHVKEVSDIDEPTRLKIKHFFDTYKMLEKGKWVKTGKYLPKAKALAEIKKGVQNGK
ncbi:MAG TPA: inorganic diphosphatase [Candidatus Woesebacteria bacterium]|nr:inorganic diphosphatase [Candidatus Woesebacteria bacterium]HNS94357.1 inorganic diphosphatase [Candidatus Woesebacteria bacterium]